MSRKIFVGGLNWSTSEAALQNIFQRFGIVQNIKLVFDQATGKSKGYAFITYDDDMAAKVAMSQMDGRQIEGRTIRVNFAFERTEEMDDDESFEPPLRPKEFRSDWNPQQARPERFDRMSDQRFDRHDRSETRMDKRFVKPGVKDQPKERIYVGGLDWNTTEDLIREAFESFGDIDDVKIVFDKQTGQSKGFCFVTFLDEESADMAIEKMDGMILDGRTIRVNKAQFRVTPSYDQYQAPSSRLSLRQERPMFKNRYPTHPKFPR